jgi:hypothetical protein
MKLQVTHADLKGLLQGFIGVLYDDDDYFPEYAPNHVLARLAPTSR